MAMDTKPLEPSLEENEYEEKFAPRPGDHCSEEYCDGKTIKTEAIFFDEDYFDGTTIKTEELNIDDVEQDDFAKSSSDPLLDCSKPLVKLEPKLEESECDQNDVSNLGEHLNEDYLDEKAIKKEDLDISDVEEYTYKKPLLQILLEDPQPSNELMPQSENIKNSLCPSSVVSNAMETEELSVGTASDTREHLAHNQSLEYELQPTKSRLENTSEIEDNSEMTRTWSVISRNNSTEQPTLKLYICNVCRKEYRTIDRMKKHVQSKCGTVGLFKCNECKMEFIYRFRFKEHINSKCGTLPLFRCDDCNRDFRSKYGLHKHLKTISHFNIFYM